MTLRVSDSDDPLALLIDVIDEGPGIDESLRPTLFERGPRMAPGAGSRRKGLGLYIVHRVMELHGGSVNVERSGPQGTTIRLVLVQE